VCASCGTADLTDEPVELVETGEELVAVIEMP
jgi:hypothetical protein